MTGLRLWRLQLCNTHREQDAGRGEEKDAGWAELKWQCQGIGRERSRARRDRRID